MKFLYEERAVTPHVTNPPGNLDRVAVNPNDPKAIGFSNEEIEI
jgi:hypothetical protein